MKTTIAVHSLAARIPALSSDEVSPPGPPEDPGGDAKRQPLRPGMAFGQYQVRSVISEGPRTLLLHLALGAGPPSVLDRVLKIAVPSAALDEEVRRQFQAEYAVGRSVHHPGIVRMDDWGIFDGCPYLMMEWLPGHTLRTYVMPSGGLAATTVASLLTPVVDVLSAIHRHGVVHRDIKPENLFRTATGQIKVIDFGLAVCTQQARQSCGIGTPAYMAPEQALGLAVDERSDQYSLGVVAFELLTGQLPFFAPDVGTLLAQHVAAAPPRLSALRPDLPPAWDTIMAKTLAKRPEDRFPNLEALLLAITESQLAGHRRRSQAPPSLPPAETKPAPTPPADGATGMDIVMRKLRQEWSHPLGALHDVLELLHSGSLGRLTARGRLLVDGALLQSGGMRQALAAWTDLSQLRHGVVEMQRQVCDCAEIAELAVSSRQAALDSRLLQLNAFVTSEAVWGDRMRLVEVMEAMLDNSIESAPHGSVIHLQVRAEAAGVVWSVSNTADTPAPPGPVASFNGTRELDCHDGAPMDSRHVELDRAREIVIRHRGRTWVSIGSRETTFSVALPPLSHAAVRGRHYKTIIEAMPDACWLEDIQHQRVLYASPAFEAIWRQPKDSLLTDGAAWLFHVHPDDRRRVAETVSTGENGVETFRLLPADGSQRRIRLRFFEVRDAWGEAVAKVYVAEDMTVP